MKASDVVNAVREMLKDTEAEYVWTEPFLRSRLNEGVYALREARGEAKLDDTTGHTVAYTEAANPSDTLCVSDHWKNHLIEFVLWKAYGRDASDHGHQARAKAHREAWERLLQTA